MFNFPNNIFNNTDSESFGQNIEGKWSARPAVNTGVFYETKALVHV